MSHWVFTPVQPAHCTVIRSHRDLLPIEVTLEVHKGLDHCQQFLAGHAVPLLAPLQLLTNVGNDTLLPVLDLGQHRSRPDNECVGVEVPQPFFTGKPLYQRTRQSIFQLAKRLVPTFCPLEVSSLIDSSYRGAASSVKP